MTNIRVRATLVGGVFALVIVLVGAIAYQTRNDEPVGLVAGAVTTTPADSAPSATTAPPTTTPPETTAPDQSPSTTVSVASSTTSAPALAPAGCPAADGSSPRLTTFDEPPPTCIDPSMAYTAKIVTSKGTMEFVLFPGRAPVTVNNFVFLARNHFYDGLVFHRIVPDFVLQTGDPTEVGDGGPGYTIADELPAVGQYRVGSLAMASAGPDTGGSQFFIISGPEGAAVDPAFSLFGQLTSGLDVVRTINGAGAPDPDPPTERITITSITITESKA